MRRLLLCFVAALSGVLGGCGSLPAQSSGEFQPRTADTLTVVTQPLPTVGFWEGTGQRPTSGFEWALSQALAERFGLHRVVYRTREFSLIVDGEIDDADVALSLITPTNERAKLMDFSTPYIQSAPALLVRKGTEVPDLHTAQKLRWAVGAGTTFERIVADVIGPKQPPRRYEDRSDEIAAVSRGTVDVAMFDLPAAQAIVNGGHPELSIAAKLVDTEPIAAALPKGSSNTEAVSAALRALQADGTIDELADRYLGRSFTELDATIPLLRTQENG